MIQSHAFHGYTYLPFTDCFYYLRVQLLVAVAMCKEESITTEVAKGEEESAVGEAATGEDGGYENGGEGVREE
ncbi:hypothetical protein L2E82_15027 [Cichorium intybus]|uniref:Uncharacterized protein n=1 Tax=Cichorium intybus TaxID=13427 RepID=A0ACB9F1P0_CICIN|nr:hypothetical protein L2E82_15027 [Cichorium intybus]